MQRDTETHQECFFPTYIYSGRTKQFTSIVDNDETKKERDQINDHAHNNNNTSEKRADF
jgi:hypothetical protein